MKTETLPLIFETSCGNEHTLLIYRSAKGIKELGGFSQDFICEQLFAFVCFINILWLKCKND